MKVHSTNYTNSFISIAEDCKIEAAEIPPIKLEKTSLSLECNMK